MKNEAWVKNPIDAFVLAKLEAQGIEPSAEANRRTLARRVSLDLIGLPPTPQEIDRFLNDGRDGAYERYVDGLLESPHYGEKWARHWLDQAHFADSDGYETDHIRPHAWRWRDWVINALNSNMAFDQFTVEQIAADLLPNATTEQRIATGFLRNTLTNREGGIDREEFRVEQVIDRTSTVGTIWLGYLSNPKGVSPELQRSTIEGIRDINQQNLDETGDWEIASRMATYELAFRMQSAGPELIDLSQESEKTLEAYGVNNDTTRPFGTNCLLARRMVERGVRYVQLLHGSWDDHRELIKSLKKNCDMTDQPVAALLKDLKERGLLDSTLVIWAGEFGRTPLVQLNSLEKGAEGRDHHPFAYSIWMAGAGIKGGQTIGATDELGLNVVEDKTHVHDLQATVLHLLGLDHTRLTYRHLGRDFRLTDVAGELITKALA